MNKLEELEKKYKELGEEIKSLKSQSGKRWRGEYAEKVLEKILIYSKLKDLASRLNKGEPVDWKDTDQSKWYIYFDNAANSFDFAYHSTNQSIGEIYCLDPDFLDRALDEIGEEDLMKLFEE